MDQLTELLGGEEAVAEMTGRKGLLKRNEDGKIVYAVREIFERRGDERKGEMRRGGEGRG